MTINQGTRPRAASGNGGMGLAFACIGVAGILLVLAMRRPPMTLCDPVIGLASVAFAASQALFVIGLGWVRRKGVPQLFAAVAPFAWAMLAGAVLVMRQCAGDIDAIVARDVVFGVAGVVGLFLMLHGMALRLEKSGLAAWLAVAALALVLSLGWVKVMEQAPTRRTWRSWEAVNEWNDAITLFKAKTGKLPELGGSLEAVASQVEQALGTQVPRLDGWARELVYSSDGKGYEIASRGAFGERGPVSAGAVRGFSDDIVIADGVVVAWPESPCRSDEDVAAQAATEAKEPKELPVPEGAIDKRHERRRR